MLINDLGARVEGHKNELLNAISKVVDSGWFVLGPEVKAFEREFAQYVGAAHCLSVANGTDAIELALKALGVVDGDLVATVANAGMYTTGAMLSVGATPYFMDVDLHSQNVSLAEVQLALQRGVRAVVVTHLYGNAVSQIAEIASLCSERGVPLLEDCAQAHGARVLGRCVGTFGDASSFSFYPTKNLGALGDGGAVVTRSDTVAAQLERLRQYGWTTKYKVGIPGGRNSRLDELQASILRVFLPRLDAANDRRRAIALQYSKDIQHPQVQLPAMCGEMSVAHLYVIRSLQRDNLRKHLQNLGIASDVHYPVPDHQQGVFEDTYATLSLTNTETLAAEILTLPCYPEMSDVQTSKVVDAVNTWTP